jgi:hypothetical protein
MFTLEHLRKLLRARPFVPFRLILSDGGSVEIRSPEVALPGRRFVIIGLLDPDAADTAFDQYTVVWYMHVTRAEQLQSGPPPMGAEPPGPAESSAGKPA